VFQFRRRDMRNARLRQTRLADPQGGSAARRHCYSHTPADLQGKMIFSLQVTGERSGVMPRRPELLGEKENQCSEAACFGLGGKARLVSVPRISASAVCKALSSFASFGM
jgi:hypothetical protein